MWIAVTNGPEGPFGLVAEDIRDRMYRGSPTKLGIEMDADERKIGF